MTDFKPDQAKLQAAYDAKLSELAALWVEIGALEDQHDEKMRAVHDAEMKLNAWLPYFDSPPQGSIEGQLQRVPREEADDG